MDELNTQEVAMLASMNKSANKYSPLFIDPDKEDENYENKRDKEKIRMALARDRYNSSLRRMHEDGYISDKTFKESSFKVDEDLDKSFASLRPIKNRTFEYGNRMVKEFLLTHGYTENEISNIGGLRVYTTIDSKIQKIASDAFEKHLQLVNEGLDKKKQINGAFIIIGVDGEIKALSGGNNFNETQYNRVMALRSPGSGFKPFAYATAIEYGKNFSDRICNCPFSRKGANGKIWSPGNFREDNPVRQGWIPLSQGFTRSVNLATLNLIMSLYDGVESEIKLVNSMGIHGVRGVIKDSEGKAIFRQPGSNPDGKGIEHNLPTVIGASGISMLELANAYAVFLRKGVYLPPTLIKEIRSTYGDEILFKAEKSEGKQVLSEKTANMILAMMRKVTQDGTAKISMRGIKQPIACKTGTSNGPKDVSIWCVTPEYVIAFRFGNDDFSEVMEAPAYMKRMSGSASTQVTGGWIAGYVTRMIVDAIYADREIVGFSPEVEELDQMLLAQYPD
jgi:membrane peptidoglycan carboxypeptidase